MKFYSLIDSKGNFLADIVEFDDGQVVVKWDGKVKSLVIHKCLQEFIDISVHNGRTLLNEGLEEIN